MTRRLEFDVAFWRNEMRQADGNYGRIAVLHRTGILDRVLDSGAEIRAAIQEIRLIYPGHITVACGALVKELMKGALPGTGWYEFYQQVVHLDRSLSEKLFIYTLACGRHSVNEIGQVLLAISESDFKALKLAWADRHKSFCWRDENEHTLRDLMIHAAFTSSDPRIFTYLDKCIKFNNSLPLLHTYWRNSISETRPELSQAIMQVDKFVPDELNGYAHREIFESVFDACRNVPDLESPPYQILALLLFRIPCELNHGFFRSELRRMVLDPGTRGIIIWCLGRPINDLLDPYQVIKQAHLTTDSELLFLVMQSFEISTSDLMEWCDQQGDQFDPSWFGTILKAKSARSSPE